MSSRRLMPPEYLAARWSPASASRNLSSNSSARSAAAARPKPLRRAKKTRFSLPVSSPSTAANWPVREMCWRTCRGWDTTSAPHTVIVPEVGFISVEAIFTNVVLPAPLAPSSETT